MKKQINEKFREYLKKKVDVIEAKDIPQHKKWDLIAQEMQKLGICYGLGKEQAKLLTEDKPTADYFEAVMATMYINGRLNIV